MSPSLVRFTIAAPYVRALAGRRVTFALAALPLLVIVVVMAIVISASLALVAVLCAFFSYGCITIAQRQRRTAAEASDWELVLDGNRVVLPAERPRRVVCAIDRPDYLRLMSTDQKVAGFWFDARRDPTAFVDIPLPRAERETLHGALRTAGVPVRHESSGFRALALLGMLVLSLSGLIIARVALKLSVTAIASAPATYGVVLVAGGLMVWTWRRTR